MPPIPTSLDGGDLDDRVLRKILEERVASTRHEPKTEGSKESCSKENGTASKTSSTQIGKSSISNFISLPLNTIFPKQRKMEVSSFKELLTPKSLLERFLPEIHPEGLIASIC